MNRLLRLLRNPVSPETKPLLDQKWHELSPEFRTDRQIYGRNEEGCGGTVGAMPKCDFACRGCYLTKYANRVPELPIEAVKKQLHQLREYLGPWGNLQLTDGELTLRDESELIEIIRYAREIELIPMLMTHGDSFRRNPGLLERLMVEGGLDEMSLHIDSTQRGRLGYKSVDKESELNPVRIEFAEMVREARKKTGLPLRVASTITITPEAVEQIPDILECTMKYADVYRLISFLPIAQVGRTEDGFGGGVTPEEVWDQVSMAIKLDSERWHWHMGHPSCSRFLMGYHITKKDGSTAYLPLSMAASEDDAAFMKPFFEHFAGITFRADRGLDSVARILGMLLKAPVLMTRGSMRLGWSLLKRIDSGSRLVTLLDLITGSTKLHRLTLATHHFMSEEEAESPLGRQRIEHCVFKVADGEHMVSMCEFNALWGRERLYRRLQDEGVPALTDPCDEVLHL